MTIAISGTNGITLDGQFNSASSMGFKNRIINGAMVIDQRNAGAVQTFTGSAYSVDRFRFGLNSPSAINSQQVSDAPVGFSNSLKVTCISAASPAAADQNQITQRIEGYNFFDFSFGTASAKTLTISFFVKSSLTGIFGASLGNSAGNRYYTFSYEILSANTWEQKIITINGDTSGTWVGATNGIGIVLLFDMGSGTDFQGTINTWQATPRYAPTSPVRIVTNLNATWQITGVQLEKGSTATSFDYRPYGTEMSLCQRYYWRLGGSQFGGAYMPFVLMNAISTTSLSGGIQFPVRVRTPPTSITLGGSAPAISGGTISTNMTLDRPSLDGVITYITGTGFVAFSSYRWIGSSDATTFLSFEGMEL